MIWAGTTIRRLRASLLAAACVALTPMAMASPAQAQSTTSTTARVLVTTVDGAITPVVADHLERGIRRAEDDGFAAYVVRLDTPGGLDTSMRDIVQDILASDVPVIVHISPQGARGASAGAVIAYAAHVAAMAPGTSIGAATPVGGGGGEDLDAKIVNDAVAYVESLASLRGRDRTFIAESVRDGRSASAEDALALGVVDIVAAGLDELLAAADGRTASVGVPVRDVTLSLTGAEVVEQDWGLFERLRQFLADPNIAFLLLSIGTLAILYELATPGLGAGAAVGVTSIVLALVGLAVVPLNAVGVVFLLLAAVLFVAEVVSPGIGIAAAGGVLSLVLGGVFLVDDAPGIEVSLWVVLPTALLVGALVVVAGRLAARARLAPAPTGVDALMGLQATVRVMHGSSQVFVQGAWWQVRADPADGTATDALVDGQVVEIVGADGLTLHARPVVAVEHGTGSPSTFDQPPGAPT
jgi:membrane-bound serine protease (ClpP class)